MKKIIIWILILIVSHVAVFIGGSVLGGRISKAYLSQEFEKVNAPISLFHYVQFRDLVKSINTGELDTAKCGAELGASSNLDDVKACLASDYCKDSIVNEVRKKAPEIFSGAPLGFDYKKETEMEFGAVRRCD